MALCDPCYDLFCLLEPDQVPEEQCHEQDTIREVSGNEDEHFAIASVFRDWLRDRFQDRFSDVSDECHVLEDLPHLPGLIHSSWQSFCKSLDNFCPVCWVVWRHIRESPMASYRNEARQGFYLWFDRGVDLKDCYGRLYLCCSTDIHDWDNVALLFKRTTKQRFEEVVAQTPLEQHMGSATTLETVKNWLSMCDKGHGSESNGCVVKRRAVNKPAIPTRLINVHSYGSQTWSLIESKNHDSLPKYVALSHRWTTDTPRLLQGNYLDLQTDQRDEVLPQSYQDVFVLCRGLEIQYVWIDSLCIFQDSADDFLREAATMKEVYANAFCTFSVCWEFPCGFLRPREPRALARWIDYDKDSVLTDRYVFVKDDRELQKAISRTPVNQRGWVLQEQLLSPRVLYLGNDQIYWQCDDTSLCETAPEVSYNLYSLWDYERKNLIAHKDRNHSTWQNLVVQFMGLDLTFERDRLLAISGIARFFLSPIEGILPNDGKSVSYQENEKEPDETIKYVAGLQRAHWIEDLLWCPFILHPWELGFTEDRHKIGPGSFNRQPDDIVPSWSWAACPGPIRWILDHGGLRPSTLNNEMPMFEGGPMAYLRNIKFEPLGNDVYGLPKSASLEISCLLVQARYWKDDNPKDWLQGIEGPAKQAKNKCFHVFTDGFLLPLPYPRTHINRCSGITVPLEVCINFVPTCFLVPLLYQTRYSESTIWGLVVQESPQSDGSINTRDCVRIGSFTMRHGDEVINALQKNLPAEGDEFERSLRRHARKWKKAKLENPERRTKRKPTAKAKWTTIRLV